MSDDQFAKLFKYMQDFRRDVDERFNVQDQKIAGITGAVAELSAEVKDHRNETLVLSRQVDRLRTQVDRIRTVVKQIALVTGVKPGFEL